MTAEFSSLVYAAGDGGAPGYFVVDANPNGTLEAPDGSFAVNSLTGAAYIKTTTSATSWVAVSGGSVTPAALTKTNDTNVTLTLGGTPASALLQDASLTLGWTGQLAVARGGTGNAALAALTKTDDTNVTLTLGGTPASALVNAASLALGWTGQLAVARGGSGAATLTGYLKGAGVTAFTASATIPYSDLTGTPAIPAAANPSNLIGMTAANGVATTFGRSDGTHAIDPAIMKPTPLRTKSCGTSTSMPRRGPCAHVRTLMVRAQTSFA